MYASQTFVNLAEWSFAHNLGKKPGVEVLDQFGDVISGPDVIVDETTVTARWPGPMSGTIVCS